MVALFINFMNGANKHHTGRSVNNQRIERLWRDVYQQVVFKYYNLFYGWEDRGLLDVENQLHILALHTVFLPKINENLEVFARGGTFTKFQLRTIKLLTSCG